MAAPIQKQIPLRDIVYSYSEQAKQNEAQFVRLWRLAFRGFKQMGLNSFWEQTTERLVVNANKTATLPPPYLKWIRIGQLNSQGEFQTLAINEQLTTFNDTSSTRISDISPEIQSALLGPCWFNGSNFLGYDACNTTNPGFGIGSHLLQPGECKVDEKNNVIVLGTGYPYPHVYLSYLASPMQNADYEIPMEFEEAMIAWLSWQDKLSLPASSHFGNNQTIMAAQHFSRQLKLAKKMYSPFNIALAEQYFREAQKLNVKG